VEREHLPIADCSLLRTTEADLIGALLDESSFGDAYAALEPL
jgi:hypothetical protein